MPTSTKPANAHAVVATGWTNPSNAFATTGDNVYATTASTSKNTTLSGDFGFADFTTGDIPDGATIDQVRAVVEWGFTAAITGATLGCQGRVSGTNSGTELTKTTTTEEQGTAIFGAVTLSDLRSASTLVKVRIRSTRGNTTAASTFQLDFVRLEVDYTEAPPPISGSGGVSFAAPSLAAAGIELIAGTSSTLFSRPDLAGAGNVGEAGGITGTSDTAIGAPVLAGTGTMRIAGTGAVTFTKPSLAGAAVERIVGTSAVAVSKPNLAAAGTIRITGFGGVTFDAPALAGEGVQTQPGQIAGTSAIRFARPSLSGSGVVMAGPVSGDSAIAFGAPILAGTAALRIVGFGGVLIASPSLYGAQITAPTPGDVGASASVRDLVGAVHVIVE